MVAQQAPRGIKQAPIYSRLLQYLMPRWYLLFASLAGFTLYSLGTVLLADLLQFLLDALGSSTAAHGSAAHAGILSGFAHRFVIAPDQPALEVARIVIPIAVVLITALRGLGYLLGNYSIAVLSRALVHTLRCKLFDALLAQPAQQLDAHSQGALVAKVTYNVEQLAEALTNALKTVLRESLILIALLAYMAYIDWRLCLVFLAVTPALVLIVRAVSRRFRRYSARLQSSMGDVTQVANESFGGFREVRMSGAQAQQGSRFAAASDANRQQSVTMVLVESLSTPLLQMLVAMAFAVLIWLALAPDRLAALSAGQLVAFLTAASQLGKPVRQLSAVQGVLQRGRVAAQDVFTNLDQPAEPDQGNHSASAIAGNISFESVSFSYPGSSALALNDVSFSVGAGETVAIVGRSGSGKSTLFNLVTRFYTPSTGAILLDGMPIGDYELAGLRRKLAIVSQHVPLFRDTVRNNICFGCSGKLTPQALNDALEQAHAIEFIEALPQGLNTVLGDDGAGLSGGQQQRIALARALLKDAPVLLLDEATSALDAESELHVQNALQAVTHGRTTLVIAHRLSTVEQADHIVVLDSGSVVATGTHTQLLERSEHYRRLHRQDFVA